MYSQDEYFNWFTNVINAREGSEPYAGDVQNERVIRLKELVLLLQVSKSHIYKQVQLGYLPSPVKLGIKASGWLLSEINEVRIQSGLSTFI
ncbi:helix-turn-helix transcriptional regulator [Vibrio astriarenae]